jgi:hypothetical protein
MVGSLTITTDYNAKPPAVLEIPNLRFLDDIPMMSSSSLTDGGPIEIDLKMPATFNSLTGNHYHFI